MGPTPLREPTSDTSSRLTTESPSPWKVQLMRMVPRLCVARTASPFLTEPLPPSTGLLMPLVSVLSLPSSPSPLSQNTPYQHMLRSRSTLLMLSVLQVSFGMKLLVHGFKSKLDQNLL